MSKKTDKNGKKSQVEESNIEDGDSDSPWYYFYTQGCGWCKRSEPIVDELIKEGHDILKLDLADADNQALNQELKEEYKVQCGTPWFINEATGKGICGFREKDILEIWLDGKDIPAPPRPKGPIPKVPLLEASNKEVSDWKKNYTKWLKDNDHLPKAQKKSADDILKQPRPKTEPPSPPQPSWTDEQVDEWGKEYDKWTKENTHLPNLQPVDQVVARIKAQKSGNKPVNKPESNVDSGVLNTLDAKIQALEVKVDKIISHFGIK